MFKREIKKQEKVAEKAAAEVEQKVGEKKEAE